MNLPEQLAALVIMFVLAWLSWRFVEQPLRASGLTTRRQLFGGMAALTAVFFAFAGAAHLAGGFPQRFSQPARGYASAITDINSRRQACDRPSPARIDSDDICTVGDESAAAHSFMVIGDSFSEALMPGFSDYARRRGLKGYYLPYSGCFPLVGVDEENRVCRAFTDNALAFVSRHPEIRTIVLVSRWTSAYFGNRFGQLHGNGWFIRDDQSTEASYAENRHVFRRSFERLFARLPDRNVVILAHIPEQRYDVPRALALNALYGTPARVPLPMALHAGRQEELRSLLAEFDRRGRARVVDAGAPLCRSGECIVQNGTSVLYVDDNHLSAKGAVYLIDLLGDRLLP